MTTDAVTLAEVREAWYTVSEIAERLKVNPYTVRRWLRDGTLHGHNLGGQAGWRVRESDFEAFLTQIAGEQDDGREPSDG